MVGKCVDRCDGHDRCDHCEIMFSSFQIFLCDHEYYIECILIPTLRSGIIPSEVAKRLPQEPAKLVQGCRLRLLTRLEATRSLLTKGLPVFDRPPCGLYFDIVVRANIESNTMVSIGMICSMNSSISVNDNAGDCAGGINIHGTPKWSSRSVPGSPLPLPPPPVKRFIRVLTKQIGLCVLFIFMII